MRRASCVVFTVLALGLTAGQAEAQSREIGFKLGPSFATLAGAEEAIRNDFGVPGLEVSSTTRSGLAAGGFFRLGFGPASLQTELLYVQKGGGGEVSIPGEGSASIDLELDYVEVPVLLRLAVPVGLFRSYIFAGPAVSFEVGCQVRFEVLGESETEDCEDDFDRSTTDVGVMAGAGFALPVGIGRILLEARYNVGLVNLEDDPEGNNDIKNRALNVFAGFSIPLR